MITILKKRIRSMIKVTSLHHFLAFSQLVFLPILANFCFQLPPRHSQPITGSCMPSSSALMAMCRDRVHAISLA